MTKQSDNIYVLGRTIEGDKTGEVGQHLCIHINNNDKTIGQHLCIDINNNDKTIGQHLCIRLNNNDKTIGQHTMYSYKQ